MKAWLKLIRIKQWVKNAFVLAPLLFSFQFTDIPSVLSALYAFLAFSLVASAHYIVNDIQDREKDALHPQKKYRPIASGVISVKKGLVAALLLLYGGGVFVWLLGDIKVAGVIGLYLLINVLYSGKLKNIVLLDVFVIAIGFVLRVYAGAYAIHEPVSSFIFMTTLFLSLFLGFAKRKGELLRHGTASRTVLKKYGKEMLNAYLAVTMALTIMSYALWTMETNTRANLGTHRMIYSIVFVVFGMFWYVYILDKYNGSEDPTENLYKDKALLLVCCAFVGYVLFLFFNIA